MNINKESEEIVIRIPAVTEREDGSMMSTLVGIIDGDRMGFAYNIDLSYKDKPDQYTDIMFLWPSDVESFKETCRSLGVMVLEEETVDDEDMFSDDDEDTEDDDSDEDEDSVLFSL